MRTPSRLLGRTFALLFMLSAVAAASADPMTLSVTPNGRFLVQENGTPFFWQGDTNWRLYKLTRPQIDTYLDNRKAKGFNVIQGPVLLQNSEGTDFVNANGQGNTDPENPNEQWFQHIDYIVDAARARGMYVALVATWGDSAHLFTSNAIARNYGKFLGQRYQNDPNVIWITVGEYAVSGNSATLNRTWKALGKGLNEGSGGRNLITLHASFSAGLQSSSVDFHNSPWLDFNMIHSSQTGNEGSGADNWNLVAEDFNRTPVKPTIDGEAHYEKFSGWNAFDVRRRAYWSVFAGAFGHTYGANGVWQSYRGGNDDTEQNPQHTWDRAMNFAGAADMQHLRRLMESRPMLNRAPNGNVLLSFAGNLPVHIQATRDRQGRYAMVYVPEPNKELTVNLSRISGDQVRAWWFDPRNGQTTEIGTFASDGGHSFTTPNRGLDWVLVLDDDARNYPAPGVGGPLK